MRPLVLVVSPNPFEDTRAPAYESDFWLRTQSGHLASFSNLVRLFNPVGSSRPALSSPAKTTRPLAGYYLESFLKTRGYDARAVFALDGAGAWAATDRRPLAVAVSTTFITTASELARTLGLVRSGVGAGVPVVVGGQFVWKQSRWGPDRFTGREDVEARPELAPLFAMGGDPALRDPVYVASDFGEHTLLEILDAFRRGARAPDELAGIGNLVLWTPGGWAATRRVAEPVDLDRDFTRWDVVDEMPATMVPVRTSVGCPHKCEFCDFATIHTQVRLRSPSSIVEEMRLVSARGGTSIGFVDDNSLSSARRARELAAAMRASGLGLRWAGYLRADRVAAADAVLLAESGLIGAWCGIESGDPEMLRRMRKRSDPAAAQEAIEALTSAGVGVQASFVVGFPGETRETLDATAAFVNGLRPEARARVEYLIWPFYLMPGAPVDAPERRREYGLEGLLDRWQHATMGSEDVRSTWAPYLFRKVEASYAYYGGDGSALWSASRRAEAIARRRALTVAFLDGASDDVVQQRFADLHGLLRLTPGETPDWRQHLAPRERQPGAAVVGARS